MAISIHIEDVTKEQPEALWRTGAYLMGMARDGVFQAEDLMVEALPEDVQWLLRRGYEPATNGDETVLAVPKEVQHEIYRAEGFPVDAAPAPDLTAVFGAHRPTHGSPELDADAEKLTALAGAGAAGLTLSDLNLPPVPPAIEPPPSAPVAGVPVPPPAAPGDRRGHDLDARGFPWDARIHGRTKAKIGDGTWRYRRGSTDEEIALVEAELRQTMGAGVPVAPAPVAPAPVAPAPVAPAPVAPEDFGAFMQFVISSVASGKIQQPQVIAIVNEFGLPHVGAVFQRQDLIPQIRAKIEALVA